MPSILRQGGSLDTSTGHDAICDHSRSGFRSGGEEHRARKHSLWAEGLRRVRRNRVGLSVASLFFTFLTLNRFTCVR